MKSISLLLLLISVYACQTTDEYPNEMEDQNKTLIAVENEVVAFYNVENLFDIEDDPETDDDDFTPTGEQRWTQERYTQKLNKISKVLFDLGDKAPMLIGLVEIENQKVVEDLGKSGELANRKYRIAHFDSEDRRGIDCALLYDENRMAVLEKEKLVVRIPDNENYLTRDILYVKSKLNNDEILHIFVNHWSSRREGVAESEHKRVRAAQVLSQKIQEIKKDEPEAKILIMGDFNDTPHDKSIRLLSVDSDKKNTFTNLMTALSEKGEGSIVHERKWYLFDQMLVTQNLLNGNGIRVKDQRAHIYRSDEIIYTYKNGGQKPNSTYGGPEYYGGFSDHLPVYLILEQ